MDPPPSLPRLGACAAAAAALWLTPPPAGLGPAAWHTFAVFTGVVAGFLLRPLPMAPVVLLGLLVLVATSTISLEQAIAAGYGNRTVWLVVSAFLLAGVVERTGLGRRVALILLHRLGRSLLGLGYAIAATELLLGPFVPSNTARGGGIISPVVRGLAGSLGSRPGDPSRSAGAYLVQNGAHANLVASAMFLTAMAGNTLLVPLGREHLGVEWDFGTWLLGSIVPGLAGMVLVPVTLLRLERPPPAGVSQARARVEAELEALGPWTRREITLAAVLVALLGLWALGPSLRWHSTTVALLGILAVLLTRTETWDAIVRTQGAWDALIWLGGFVALAEALKSTGFAQWFGELLAGEVAGGSPVVATVLLALVYFLTMVLFSQLTAHIAALAGVFLALAARAGAPPFLALAVFSYFSCLCGLTTPWSSGPVIIYFGFGYVGTGRWMRNGVAAAAVQLAVWLAVGLWWWKCLGWW